MQKFSGLSSFLELLRSNSLSRKYPTRIHIYPLSILLIAGKCICIYLLFIFLIIAAKTLTFAFFMTWSALYLIALKFSVDSFSISVIQKFSDLSTCRWLLRSNSLRCKYRRCFRIYPRSIFFLHAEWLSMAPFIPGINTSAMNKNNKLSQYASVWRKESSCRFLSVLIEIHLQYESLHKQLSIKAKPGDGKQLAHGVSFLAFPINGTHTPTYTCTYVGGTWGGPFATDPFAEMGEKSAQSIMFSTEK